MQIVLLSMGNSISRQFLWKINAVVIKRDYYDSLLAWLLTIEGRELTDRWEHICAVWGPQGTSDWEPGRAVPKRPASSWLYESAEKPGQKLPLADTPTSPCLYSIAAEQCNSVSCLQGSLVWGYSCCKAQAKRARRCVFTTLVSLHESILESGQLTESASLTSDQCSTCSQRMNFPVHCRCCRVTDAGKRLLARRLKSELWRQLLCDNDYKLLRRHLRLITDASAAKANRTGMSAINSCKDNTFKKVLAAYT